MQYKKYLTSIFFVANFTLATIVAQTCSTKNCAYTQINCEECCKAKTGVSPECCAACNNCTLFDDGGRSGCKDFPS